MKKTTFTAPIDDRYLEDYTEGAVYEFDGIAVKEAEIISFAKRFDPQPFHTDPEAGQKSMYGSLIASGWHSAAMMMRLFVDSYLSQVASLGSPGVDELRWLKPVCPGDDLIMRVTVVEIRRSRSKPDRGLLRSHIEVLNQRRETVMTMMALNLLLYREAP